MDTDIRFIELVKKNPMLYNKRSGTYKRSDLKLKTWAAIAAKMGYSSAEEAMKRWKSLRDKFVKLRRKLKAPQTGGSGSDEEEEIWPLFSHLEFLGDFVRQRPTYSNVAASSQQKHKTDGESSEEEVLTLEIISDENENTGPGPSDMSERETQQTVGSALSATRSAACNETPRKQLQGKSQARSRNSRTPSSSRSRSGSPAATPLEDAVIKVGTYFAHKQAQNSDSAFCQYLNEELKTMKKRPKNELKKIILNFIAELPQSDSE